MKNIYFVQAGNLYGVNAHLPYGAGCVAANAWSNPVIRAQYRLGHFTILRTPVPQAVDSFENPYMVAFSNYVWNFEYHKALAIAVKERYPGCLILFGGHQVLNDESRQLQEYPFVDFLIHRAGEIPFEQLLLTLLQGRNLANVPSISYRDAEGQILRTKEAPNPGCDFPSPYLTGIFEELFTDYPQLLFSMTFETNRGCPYYCSYCDWGADRQSFHRMPMDRVTAEIDWAAQHKIEFVLCADANFGILERDDDIVDYLIESKRRTGYPKKLRACLAKDSNETIFRLNQKLCAHELHNGAALSFQSISLQALECIGRSNLTFERFQELISLYIAADVPVYSELILGLPGETLESFAAGIGKVLDAGIHGALEIFRLELLPNAEMASAAYIEQHGLKAIRVRQHHRHASPENQDEIPEYTELVYQTSTMPTADWVTSNVFSDVVQGFHCLGLLTCFAVYLRQERQLPYETFYFDLMDYAKANPSTLIGELLPFCIERYWALSQGAGESIVYDHPTFGEVTWTLGEMLFLRSAFESGRFYDEIRGFIQQYRIDAEVSAQLFRFQRTVVLLPAPPSSAQTFDYDFPAYFSEALAGRNPTLLRKHTTISFPAQRRTSSWADFSRDYVWYGRRKGSLTKRGYEVQYE